MNKFVKFGLIFGLAAMASLFLFLLTWDIPAPSQTVEREIADDDFPK